MLCSWDDVVRKGGPYVNERDEMVLQARIKLIHQRRKKTPPH